MKQLALTFVAALALLSGAAAAWVLSTGGSGVSGGSIALVALAAPKGVMPTTPATTTGT